MVTAKDFEIRMENRSQPDARVSSDTYSMLVGKARATVRLAGAYITDLTLVDLDGWPHQVLAGEKGDRVKLSASHGMSQKEYGDQHGRGRRVDYSIVSDTSARQFARLNLRAKVPKDGLQINRAFKLTHSDPNERKSGQFEIATSLKNNSQQPVRQRLGEHLYFNLPHGKSAGLRIANGDGTDPLENPAVLQEAMAGNFQMWPSSGPLEVVFPEDDKHFLLAASVELRDADGKELPTEPMEMGWMLWHRPGLVVNEDDELLCIEPVFGYDKRGADVSDGGFELPIGAIATLRTAISLRDAEAV